MQRARFEQRVSLITIGVSDISRARKFYVDGLGWQPVFEQADIVFIQLNAIVVGLWSRDNLAKDAGLTAGEPADKMTRADSANIALAYNTRSREEVDTLLNLAKESGAKLPAPAEEKPWGGYSGYFVDPDGHLWEVAWNPGFQLDADGKVTFGLS